MERKSNYKKVTYEVQHLLKPISFLEHHQCTERYEIVTWDHHEHPRFFAFLKASLCCQWPDIGKKVCRNSSFVGRLSPQPIDNVNQAI